MTLDFVRGYPSIFEFRLERVRDMLAVELLPSMFETDKREGQNR